MNRDSSEVVPGAVMVRTWTLGRRSTLSCTMMYSAISIAKAMRVRKAAMKARSDASRTSVICDETENRRAIKVAPVAGSECETHQCPEWSRRIGRTYQMDAQLGRE